jgi:hypothetical protein
VNSRLDKVVEKLERLSTVQISMGITLEKDLKTLEENLKTFLPSIDGKLDAVQKENNAIASKLDKVVKENTLQEDKITASLADVVTSKLNVVEKFDAVASKIDTAAKKFEAVSAASIIEEKMMEKMVKKKAEKKLRQRKNRSQKSTPSTPSSVTFPPTGAEKVPFGTLQTPNTISELLAAPPPGFCDETLPQRIKKNGEKKTEMKLASSVPLWSPAKVPRSGQRPNVPKVPSRQPLPQPWEWRRMTPDWSCHRMEYWPFYDSRVPPPRHGGWISPGVFFPPSLSNQGWLYK